MLAIRWTPRYSLLDAIPLDMSTKTNSAIPPGSAGNQDSQTISNSIFTAKEEEHMLKRLLIFSTIVLCAAQIAIASDREDDAT